jgi:hypothetical protein
MATALDQSLKNVIDRITAPGELLELGTIERFGRQLPMLKNAPPTLVAYFDHFCLPAWEYKPATGSGSPRAIRPTGLLPTWAC